MTAHPPRPIRPSDLERLAATITLLGTRLAAPCTCGRTGCTAGEHLWRATRDALPGIPARPLEPTRGGTTGLDLDDRPQRPPEHENLAAAARQLQTDADTILILLDLWAHRRKTVDDTATDDQWCSWHLSTIGVCEARYRGDQCRFCYDFSRLHGMMPPAEILQTRHEGRRVTTAMVADVKAKQRQKRKRARRKARR